MIFITLMKQYVCDFEVDWENKFCMLGKMNRKDAKAQRKMKGVLLFKVRFQKKSSLRLAPLRFKILWA